MTFVNVNIIFVLRERNIRSIKGLITVFYSNANYMLSVVMP